MTDLEKQKAEAEIAKWFWQPEEGHNFRYKYAVRTLTRFYEMVTPAADTMKLILEYLRTQETLGTISLLGKQVDLGSGWVAKDAWYQTAAGDEFAGTKQNKVRVYQTLMLASEDAADGDGPYTVEDGCQYAVEHTFYWNVAELPTLPASSSGIQYTMQSVFRDSETGLFSCVIEKRERVQQDVALYGTAKTIFETVQEEQHLGVKAADVPTTGQTASAANGVLVKRQLRKNPDCTTDVINETTTEEPVSGALVNVRRTIRGIWKRTTERNQEPDATETDPSVEVGETAEREKTPGNLRNKTKTTFESAAADGDVDLMGEHELTALEHSDVKSVVLQDDSEDTPEPQTLTIEDVTGVANPLPSGHGFDGSGDQAGGAGRKITRKRIVFNEETGQRDRQTVERTSIPYKKNVSWYDDNSDHEMLVFRNQKTVPTVKSTIAAGSVSVVPTSTTITVNINEFGLFDGVYHYTHTVSGGRSGEALAWSIGPKDISAKYYYFNKKGKLCHRVFTGTVYKCYGRSNHVANELYNQDGITPAYLPQVGWVTHMGDGLFTHGTRYTLTSVGEEVVDDDSSQSSQS